jgi:hypothetical protein
MSDRPSAPVDRAISCALLLGIVCMTLLILAVIVIGAATP